MGSCIICGTSTEGQICKTHEEDVAFEFKGTKPGQLTPGRFYRGTVDGMAEFGVFVNIGNHVTGLLHKSELDRRLESLDWDRGDEVYVQVMSVRDNGNIDLSWSIRQSEREFRGSMIDDPEADGPYVKESGEASSDGGSRSGKPSSDEPVKVRTPTGSDTESKSASNSESSSDAGSTDSSANDSAAAEETDDSREPAERVEIDSLSERVGERVRLEGTVVGVRQTGGPTIFEVRDETAAVNCAAFKEAGVRAYPEVEVDDVVRLEGTVEMHRNELQVETESLDELAGEERETVEGRLEDAVTAQARPDDVELLADVPGVAAIHDDIRNTAEAIRRAVIEARPVIVRHEATADGYLAGAAIERAVLPLVREEHAQSDAEYHYFDRRPLQDRFYDMDAATGDVTRMLDNRERHDEKLPLFVLVNAGSTEESRDGLELLDIYGAKRVAVDTDYPDDEMTDLLDALVNPFAGDADEAEAENVAVGALGGNVAVHVNPDVRDDLAHLPAASYWRDTPEAYVDLAAEAGYDDTDTDEIREALALVAHYQSYEDKREIITDLLWESDSRDLASYVSEQFRDKLETEIDTAEPNIEHREVDGTSVTILDTDAFTHRFDFPPSALLVDEIHRRETSKKSRGHTDEVGDGRETAENDGEHVTLGATDDELLVRSTDPVDIRAVAATATEAAPNAGITPKGARNGSIEFLVGEREAVIEAVVDAIADV